MRDFRFSDQTLSGANVRAGNAANSETAPANALQIIRTDVFFEYAGAEHVGSDERIALADLNFAFEVDWPDLGRRSSRHAFAGIRGHCRRRVRAARCRG